MRRTYRALAYVLVAEVVVQTMMVAIALAGVGKWVDDGHTLTREVAESHPIFAGSIGSPIHAINGEVLIPLLVLALLVVSFFAKLPGGTRRAGNSRWAHRLAGGPRSGSAGGSLRRAAARFERLRNPGGGVLGWPERRGQRDVVNGTVAAAGVTPSTFATTMSL